MTYNRQYVDPTLDWSFKKMFLTPEHKGCLQAFLNDMLEGEFVVHEIESIQAPEVDELEKKKIIYDIHCKSQTGARFIIEMQKTTDAFFLKRLDFYRSRAIASQLHQKGIYKDLLPVIVIAICDFNIMAHIFPDAPHDFYFEKIRLSGEKSKRFAKWPAMFVLLDLYNYKEKNFPKKSVIEEWFELFTCCTLPREIISERKEIEMLLNGLAYQKLSEKEKLIIQSEEDYIGARDSELFTAIQKGEKRGEKRGEKKGIAKAKRENALRMLQDGLDQETVAKYVGLSMDEVRELMKSRET